MQVGAIKETVTVTGSRRGSTCPPRGPRAARNPSIRLGGASAGVADRRHAAASPAAAPAPIDRTMVEDGWPACRRQRRDRTSATCSNIASTVPSQSARTSRRWSRSSERTSASSACRCGASAGGPRPLRSVWLTNSSELTLDAGSFTVLEGSTFAGEGLVDPIKPGEKRLLSYAVDLGVQIDARRGDEQQRVSRIRINRGVAVQQSEQMSRRVYTIRNSDASARTVIVEHPSVPDGRCERERAGRDVARRLSLRGAVEPKGSRRSRSANAMPSTRATPSRSSATSRSPCSCAARARKRGSRRRSARSGQESRDRSDRDQVEDRQTEANKIAEDQQRLRENMGALKGGAGEQQLLKRYVGQLNLQEDRIAALRPEPRSSSRSSRGPRTSSAR